MTKVAVVFQLNLAVRRRQLQDFATDLTLSIVDAVNRLDGSIALEGSQVAVTASAGGYRVSILLDTAEEAALVRSAVGCMPVGPPCSSADFELQMQQELGDFRVEVAGDVSYEIVDLTPPSIPPPAAPPSTTYGSLDLGDSNIEQSGETSTGLSSGAAAGIAIGILLGLGAAIGGYYLMVLKRRKDRTNKIILKATSTRSLTVDEISVKVGEDEDIARQKTILASQGAAETDPDTPRKLDADGVLRSPESQKMAT